MDCRGPLRKSALMFSIIAINHLANRFRAFSTPAEINEEQAVGSVGAGFMPVRCVLRIPADWLGHIATVLDKHATLGLRE